MKNAFIAMMMALLLTACGGGGGDGSSATPTASAPASSVPAASNPVAVTPPVKTFLNFHKITHALPIVIAVDGDSTNFGCESDYTPACLAGRSFDPTVLMQADFDKELGKGVVKVLTLAIPGSTFMYDLQTGGPVTVPLATRISQLGVVPDIIISNSEINDQYVLKEYPPEYITWADAWVKTVVAAGSMPILEEPNPIASVGYNISGENGSDDMVAAVATYAKAQNIPVLPTYEAFKNYPLWNLTEDQGGLMGSDDVHPNPKGYAFKESNYFPPLLTIVKSMM